MEVESSSNDIRISYGVKELLALQHESLDRIERKVDEGAVRQAEAIAKIDTRVTILEQHPRDHEERIRALEGLKWQTRGAISAVVLALSLIATMSWHIWG